MKEIFKSLLQKYQKGLEKPMDGSDLIFDSFNALYYNLDKISLSRGGSCIDSPEWLKNITTTINLKNNDDKCFQYALNYEQIKKDPQRI